MKLSQCQTGKLVYIDLSEVIGENFDPNDYAVLIVGFEQDKITGSIYARCGGIGEHTISNCKVLPNNLESFN